MHKTRGFTLIEMLLVTIIIAIILIASQSLFVNKNNTYLAETCANYMYATIKNHFYNATVGKKSSSNQKTETYITHITDNTIVLSENDNTGQNINTQTISPITAQSLRSCNKGYEMILESSPSGMTITTHKNLSNKGGTEPALTIRGDGGTQFFTGSITFKQNNTQQSQIKDILKINIDARSQNISKSTCASRNSSGGCTKRQE